MWFSTQEQGELVFDLSKGEFIVQEDSLRYQDAGYRNVTGDTVSIEFYEGVAFFILPYEGYLCGSRQAILFHSLDVELYASCIGPAMPYAGQDILATTDTPMYLHCMQVYVLFCVVGLVVKH
tara:strand:+ start:1621 stop:1986 length:366 start_codon:yes stop_codon:yes gene_type:complete